MKEKKISTFNDFHRLVPKIVKQINDDSLLCIRAAVNPLLAFEELGYILTPAVKKEVEYMIRFTPKERSKLEKLEKQLQDEAGSDVNFDDSKDIERLLFKTLKLSKPPKLKTISLPDVMTTGSVLCKEKRTAWTDPLKSLSKKHPVLKPLLAYRELQVKRPSFGNRTVYDKLKTQKKTLPISRIRINFPEQPCHEEVKNA